MHTKYVCCLSYFLFVLVLENQLDLFNPVLIWLYYSEMRKIVIICLGESKGFNLGTHRG